MIAWGRNLDQTATWDRSANCDHAAFDAADTDPHRPLEACPSCEQILRTVNTPESWADHWAEQRAEEKAYRAAVARARVEDATW